MEGKLRIYVRILRQDHEYDWGLITEDDIDRGVVSNTYLSRLLPKKNDIITPIKAISEMRLHNSSYQCGLAWSGTVLFAVGGSERSSNLPERRFTKRVRSIDTSSRRGHWSDHEDMPTVIDADHLVTALVDGEIFVFGKNLDDFACCAYKLIPNVNEWTTVVVPENMQHYDPRYCFLWEPEVDGKPSKRLFVLFLETIRASDDLERGMVQKFYYYDLLSETWHLLAVTNHLEFGSGLSHNFLMHDGRDTLFNLCENGNWFAYDLLGTRVKGKVTGLKDLGNLVGQGEYSPYISDGCNLGNAEYLLFWKNTIDRSFFCLSKVKIDNLVAQLQSFMQFRVDELSQFDRCIPIRLPGLEFRASQCFYSIDPPPPPIHRQPDIDLDLGLGRSSFLSFEDSRERYIREKAYTQSDLKQRNIKLADQTVTIIPCEVMGGDPHDWMNVQNEFRFSYCVDVVVLDDRREPPVAVARGKLMTLPNWKTSEQSSGQRRWESPGLGEQLLCRHKSNAVKLIFKLIFQHLKNLYMAGRVHGNLRNGIVIANESTPLFYNMRRADAWVHKQSHQLAELRDLKDVLKLLLIHPQQIGSYNQYENGVTEFMRLAVKSLPDIAAGTQARDINHHMFLPPVWYLDQPCTWVPQDEGEIIFMESLFSFMYAQQKQRGIENTINACFQTALIPNNWHESLLPEMREIYLQARENPIPIQSRAIVRFWHISFHHFNDIIDSRVTRTDILKKFKDNNFDIVCRVRYGVHLLLERLKRQSNDIWMDLIRQFKYQV